MLDSLLLFDLLSVKLLIFLTFQYHNIPWQMNEMLFICICLLKVELFLYYSSPLGRPPFTFHNIFEKCESNCSLMPLILKLHFHAKSIRYFSYGQYKLVTFWMIIQWTRSNWHKESFRARTTNTIINFPEKKYLEFWHFFLLIAFPGRL